jgi:hypothetical protein
MKKAPMSRVEALAFPTALESVINRLDRLSRWPKLIVVALALFFTLTAAFIGVHLSSAFYKSAPYHYDSAAYRVQALRAYQALNSSGLVSALKWSLRDKDSLDISLRLLFAPRSLLHLYGHLAVLLPFMAGFLSLLLWYVHSRTRSWLLACAAGLSLFAFPLLYDVFWGIADYWKDNIATWLLSGAAVAWLLSRNLSIRRWSFLSGALLGLLVMQRSVAAVYAAILFLPPFVLAARDRVRSDAPAIAFRRIGAVCVPAGLLSIPLLVLQWKMLHGYYLVRGYAYAKPSAVALYLLRGLFFNTAPAASGFGGEHYGMYYAPLVMAALYGFCLLATPRGGWPTGDLTFAMWLVVALPLSVVLTRAYFHGFFALWTPLLVLGLGVLLPRALPPAAARTFALVVMLLAISAASVQTYVAVRLSRRRTTEQQVIRGLIAQMLAPILASPEPHRYAILTGGEDAPLINQALFDNHVPLPSALVAFRSHDSVLDPDIARSETSAAVERLLSPLAVQPGAISIGWCRLGDVPQWPTEPISSRLLMGANKALLESPRWKVTRRIQWAGTGCMNVYESSAVPLSAEEKWRDLSFGGSPSEIPITLPLGPGVRLYGYSGRYSAENANGRYLQWLPTGLGLSVNVYAERPCSVAFEAHATPGPSRSGPLRTLVFSGTAGDGSLTIRGDEDIRFPLRLSAGMNRIDFSVREPADVAPQAGGDQRELMLALVSPHLMPSPE